MNALPPNDLRRAVSTAKLLTSDVDGEALGATRALCRVLGKHGLEPAAVLNAGLLRATSTPAPPTSARMDPQPISRPHQRQAQMCLSMGGVLECLNDWEHGFLTSIKSERSLTQRQQDKLNAIVSKIDAKVKEQSNASHA